MECCLTLELKRRPARTFKVVYYKQVSGQRRLHSRSSSLNSNPKGWVVAWLVEWLPSMLEEVQDLVPELCNLSTKEMETGVSEIQDYLQLPTVSLSPTRLQENYKSKTNQPNKQTTQIKHQTGESVMPYSLS